MNKDSRLPTTSSSSIRQARAAKRPVAATLLAACAACFVSTLAEAAPFVPRIAGIWQIVGTPEPNGCGVNEEFSGLATITFDGILTTVDPVSGRTALGEVFRLDRNEFGLGFFGTLSLGPNLLFDVEVQATLSLTDADNASGPFRTILSDPNNVLPDCVYEGTVVGERRMAMPF